ncbi:hypothetical protein [Paenibacillus solani]|uniref:DUF4367 domain-containing protein n=1 Tax=Paenibacillus solani TaxID=1705565 RepID=A0A0M1N1U5_9BACL|nr:hypothetical protein [Paenibacillus solani]KOR76000.1 hypothetical protein AM231_25465 [Paenibacillus solani]
MKKQVAIVALSSLLILGGGGFAYYSYAAEVEQEVQNSTVEMFQTTEQTIEIKQETTVGPGVPPEGLVDIIDIPAADIHIPLPEDKLSLQSSELTLNNFQAIQREYGLHLRSLFTTADGDQIRVSQTDTRKDISAVIESLKNSYLETVELTEINGFTTLYVDGEFRKVVHLISNDHLFTVASSTATLDQLMDIAKQIHE